jgi:hypothetical protein
MDKKTNKQKRQERLIKFRHEILPELEQFYDVEAHGPSNAPATMYKIIISSIKSYDYYPMGERMRVNVNDEYTWHDMSLDEMSAGVNHLKLVK